MPVQKLRTSGNLSDRVASYLIDYTRRHRLRSGADVPSEGTVSAELKVSRSVVREAYRSLRTAGILDIGNGRLPRIGALSNQAVTQFLHHALYTEQASAAQALDVRSALEVRAAELAARNRSDRDADALRCEARTMGDSLAHRRRFINADIRFHEILGRATGNPLFALLASALRASLDVTIRAGIDSRRTTAELARVAQIHAEVADAVEERNVRRARRMMTIHFREAMIFVERGARATPARRARRRVS